MKLWKVFILAMLASIAVTDVNAKTCALAQAQCRKAIATDEGQQKDFVREIITTLTSDRFEGRAPGTLGATLAEEYIAGLFRDLGFAPFHGSYFQEFQGLEFTTRSLTAVIGQTEFAIHQDIFGTEKSDSQNYSLDFEQVIFVGYGISAPQWAWDDFKGMDLRGALVIAQLSEPSSDDPAFFDGQTLSYYGRWIAKIEEAQRRGARGILLVHSLETMGYPWQIIDITLSKESLILADAVGESGFFQGFIRKEKLSDTLKNFGINLEDSIARAAQPSFRPEVWRIPVRIAGSTSVRSLTLRNVVGILHPGSTQESDFQDYTTVFAHLDHLGTEIKNGKTLIYRGAIDNSSAVASLSLSALLLKETAEKLRQPVLFAAVAAEEAGFLGSEYFVRQMSRKHLKACIALESTPVWEASKNLMAIGGEYSSLGDMTSDIAKRLGLGYSSQCK